MSLWSSVATAYEAATQSRAGVEAALAELRAERGPLAALRAFAGHTDTQLDDVVVQELEAALRTGLQGLAAASGVCVAIAAIAEWAQDPAMRAAIDRTLDQVVDGAINLGLRAGTWRAIVTGWLEQ